MELYQVEQNRPTLLGILSPPPPRRSNQTTVSDPPPVPPCNPRNLGASPRVQRDAVMVSRPDPDFPPEFR